MPRSRMSFRPLESRAWPRSTQDRRHARGAGLITDPQLTEALDIAEEDRRAAGRDPRAARARHREAICQALQLAARPAARRPRRTSRSTSRCWPDPEDLAKKYHALPLASRSRSGRTTLVVAMADPLNVAALEDLRFHSGMFIQPVLAPPSQIPEAIERYYHLDTSDERGDREHHQSEDDELVVNAVDETRTSPRRIDELIKRGRGPPDRAAHQLAAAPRGRGARERHPHRAAGPRPGRALPRRRPAAARCSGCRSGRRARRVAHQGALEPRHRREAPPQDGRLHGRDRRPPRSTCASRRCP